MTAKIDIQQQPDDINPFICELHQTLFDVLDFNPTLEGINTTLAYKNNRKKDRLKLLMMSACKLSALSKKKVIAGSKKHQN